MNEYSLTIPAVQESADLVFSSRCQHEDALHDNRLAALLANRGFKVRRSTVGSNGCYYNCTAGKDVNQKFRANPAKKQMNGSR